MTDNTNAEETATFEKGSGLQRLWAALFCGSRSLVSNDEAAVAQCTGADFALLRQRVVDSDDLPHTAALVADALVERLSSEAGFLHAGHVLALARLLAVVQFVASCGEVPGDLPTLKKGLLGAARSRPQANLEHVCVALLAAFDRDLLNDVPRDALRDAFLHLQCPALDDFVGFGEALHELGADDLAQICFMRGQGADKPLAALATLRCAQLDPALHPAARLSAAARGISVGWAIAGYGILRESIELLIDVASRIDAHDFDVLMESLEGDDCLVKIAFPDSKSRRALRSCIDREAVLSRIVESLPRFHRQSAQWLQDDHAHCRRGNA